MPLRKAAAMVGLWAATFASTVFAAEGPSPRHVPHLDHVFFIAMENHGYSQIVDNPAAVFTNNLARAANIATNYYAIGHPSLTNYLEVVGGSNFGVRSDNAPDWHNASCTTNLASGAGNTDNRPEVGRFAERSEEHTSELQSPDHLVCRLLLEKKKKNKDI